MALFHFPLFLNSKLRFYKLMGCGKNGTFDIVPDLRQWTIMVFYEGAQYDHLTTEEIERNLLGPFVYHWWKWLGVKKKSFLLEPIAGHGSWDGRSFSARKKDGIQAGEKLGVLTRATIRWSKLGRFWGRVEEVAEDMGAQKGFIYSVGIGEVPFVKQATFSIWESMEDMKAFAYQRLAHKEVIKRTRDENWYAEEMFLRFRLIKSNTVVS